MHVHVYSDDGEAKFWLSPKVALAKNYGLTVKQIGELKRIVQDHKHEIETA